MALQAGWNRAENPWVPMSLEFGRETTQDLDKKLLAEWQSAGSVFTTLWGEDGRHLPLSPFLSSSLISGPQGGSSEGGGDFPARALATFLWLGSRRANRLSLPPGWAASAGLVWTGFPVRSGTANTDGRGWGRALCPLS